MVNHLMNSWAIPVVLGVVTLGALLGWFFTRAPEDRKGVTWISNAAYLPMLKAYRSRLKFYRLQLWLLVGVLVCATIATAYLAARPVDRQIRQEALASRDIVLCLDVSGSMVPFDSEIVETFIELIPSFQGERVALAIWNSTTRTVFPLTDDYAMVEEELMTASSALSFDVTSIGSWAFDPAGYDRLIDFIAGTWLENENSSSLAGDGLASCALLFDEQDTERSRSIIYATDNQVLGDQIYSLPEAGELLMDREIKLFGIYAGAPTSTSAIERKEYQAVVERGDGLFFEAANPGLVDQIVADIQSQQAVDLDADPEVVISDKPERYFNFLMIFLVVYLLAVWRLRT